MADRPNLTALLAVLLAFVLFYVVGRWTAGLIAGFVAEHRAPNSDQSLVWSLPDAAAHVPVMAQRSAPLT